MFAYFEVSGKQLASKSDLPIQICLRLVDAKAGTLVKEFPLIDAAGYVQDGSSVIRIAREVPIANLAPGQYRLEVQASDCNGIKTPFKTADFTVAGPQ
jgi:hypothetical protein